VLLKPRGRRNVVLPGNKLSEGGGRGTKHEDGHVLQHLETQKSGNFSVLEKKVESIELRG